MDFTAHAEAFARALRGTKDNDTRAQKQLIEFNGQIQAFVIAWRTVFRVYHNPPPHRQIFDDVLLQLINDNRQLILDLSRKLSDATMSDKREGRKSILCLFHHPSHILGTFFSYGLTCLRQQQMLYATAVANLITLIVLHVRNHEYAESKGDEWHNIHRDQMEMIRRKRQARAALAAQERHLHDELISTHLWLSGFDWIDEPDRLPLELIASKWFDVANLHHTIAKPRTDQPDSHVTDVLAQVRNLKIQLDRAQVSWDTRYQEQENNWNVRYQEQQERNKRLAKKLKIQNDELDRLQSRYHTLNSKYVATAKTNERLKLENQRLKRNRGRPEQRMQEQDQCSMSTHASEYESAPEGRPSTDVQKSQLEQLQMRIAELEKDKKVTEEEKLAIETERDILTAEKIGLEEDKKALESQKHAQEISDARTLDYRRRFLSNLKDIGTMHTAPEIEQGKENSQPHRSIRSEKARYPPLSYTLPPEMCGATRREQTPAPSSRNTSRDSRSTSFGSVTTLVNSSDSASAVERRHRKRTSSSSSSRVPQDSVGKKYEMKHRDKHEDNSDSSKIPMRSRSKDEDKPRGRSRMSRDSHGYQQGRHPSQHGAVTVEAGSNGSVARRGSGSQPPPQGRPVQAIPQRPSIAARLNEMFGPQTRRVITLTGRSPSRESHVVERGQRLHCVSAC